MRQAGQRLAQLGCAAVLWIAVAGCDDGSGRVTAAQDGPAATDPVSPGGAGGADPPGSSATATPRAELPDRLMEAFEPLPERLVAVSADRSVFALYAQPTRRYGHAILGDDIEAGQLVVWRDGSTYVHTLSESFVFEDLRPRLFDVDGDGSVEVVTIRTHVERGAGIAVYRIAGDALVELAAVPEIGIPSRWLNIAAIYDLDGDGHVELAWVQTPHIGGILRVARIAPGSLDVLAEDSLYSNHAIGERNLCLSVVTRDDDGGVTLYLPTQDRRQIAGLRLARGALVRTVTIEQRVVFSQPLAAQADLAGIVQGDRACAAP